MMTLTADSLYDKLHRIQVDNPFCSYTKERCERLTPIINEIQKLKKEKNALILAHSYVHPDIIYGVADAVGDSYGLAKKAMETDADIIVFPAVRFMAETAKIVNPNKIVIDPNPNGGCSLADSITKDDVIALRKQYPDYTFVCYINTTVEVKAVCDICVTSSNVYRIIEKLPNDKIFFLPDKLMGKNVQNYLLENGIQKDLKLYNGTCYVHEEFTSDQIHASRSMYPKLTVLAHPECTQDVVQASDIVGSTSQIVNYIKEHNKSQNPFMILTECGIVSRLQVEHPETQMVGTCMMCKYMKSNSLDIILQSLKTPKPNQIIEIDAEIQQKAQKSLEEMFHYA